jgi:hypothetical protein
MLRRLAQEARMSAADRLAAEHRERLERFRRHAERARETEVSRIAIDILGVEADSVARALRGNLTRDDEEDGGGPGCAPGTRRPQT